MQQTLPECRIITVQQPWADLLVPDAGVIERARTYNPDLAARLPKDVENRTFGTDWRGPLLILAAGRRVDEEAMAAFQFNRNHFIQGVVVGVVTLVDVVNGSPSTWSIDGARHWQVTNPIRLLSPVPARGFLGIREPDPRVRHDVYARLERQRRLEHQHLLDADA